ncbi:flagellar export protein FliJ [[Clostridium] symbiosum ATCC 14940]|nr:flagellar export protein FliJ [[Clostridium] symbiosum ATCC 14940]
MTDRREVVMRRFHFQLEKVLDYKSQILDNLVGEEAAIMAKIREKEEILAGLDKEYEDCCKILNEKQKNGMDAMSMHIYENYLDTLGFRIRNARQDLELLQRQEEIKRQQLLEVKKESTSLEKLKGRRLEEYQIGFQKQMEKEIEEYISNNRKALVRI